jgi:hypothetical protein
MAEGMPMGLHAARRRDSDEEAKANNRMSSSERLVAGIAIAVILSGFATDWLTDGPSALAFGMRMPSVRSSLQTHRTTSSIVRPKRTTVDTFGALRELSFG